MEEIGEAGFLVHMLESFSCELSSGTTVLCVVLEYLEQSLADYLSLHLDNNLTNVLSLEYSLSEDESSSVSQGAKQR